jgi:branched-subunit amino acid transport protein
MSIWLVFILAGLITYLTRLSFILLIGQRAVPPVVDRVLRFIPPAVLTAIIFPEVFMKDGAMAISPSNPRMLAGLLAALVAWKTRSAVLTIVAGMAALWLISWLLPLFGLSG